MIKINSIVSKLWLVMTLLVLLVLGTYTIVHSTLLQKTYYQQQTAQLIDIGQSLAEAIADAKETATIQQLILNTTSVSGVHIVLLDNQGKVIMTQVANNRWSKQGQGQGNGRMMGHMHNRNDPFLEQDWPELNIDKVLDGQIVSTKGESEWLNTDVLSIGVPIMETDNVSGVLILHAPIPAMATRLKALQDVSIYTTIGGIFFATIVSMFLSRSLVKPLLQINNATRAMAKGEYNKKVSVNSNDEIGMLADSFNTLSSELMEKINTLERLDQTRRDFVASVSHELRTPLTIMQGYTEALQDGLAKTDQQRKEYLTYIHEEMLRLRRLVDDLLDLRRLETGHIKVYLSTVDINELVKHVLEGISPLASVKGVKIVTNISIVTPYINADGDRIAQVLINLLGNALRATKENGTISIIVKDTDDSRIEVSVSDTGPGIAQQDLPLIWERFFKVDKARTREGSGTGLGLAITKQIIDLHQGTISVDSVLGEGSEFTFTLPRSM